MTPYPALRSHSRLEPVAHQLVRSHGPPNMLLNMNWEYGSFGRTEGRRVHGWAARTGAHGLDHKETLMPKQVIAVLGGPGLQGGGVVNTLISGGKFAVRVASRNPDGAAARALAARGVGVIKGDLLEPNSLLAAFQGAHGGFVVTNFWDPTQMPRETEIGTAAMPRAHMKAV